MTLTSLAAHVRPGDVARHHEIGWPARASPGFAVAAGVIVCRRVLSRMPLRRWWLRIYAPLVVLVILAAWMESSL